MAGNCCADSSIHLATYVCQELFVPASSSMKSSYSPFHIVFIILVSYCIFVNFNIISDIAIEFRKSKFPRRIRKLLTSKVCFFLDFFFMLNSPTSRTPSAPAARAAPAAPTAPATSSARTVPATSEALAGQESQRLQGLKRRLLLGVGPSGPSGPSWDTYYIKKSRGFFRISSLS